MAHSGNRATLEERVVHAAEGALERRQFVSATDVLVGMGLLPASRVEDWRKGQLDFLERAIQGSPDKIAFSMAVFRRWAEDKGLRPSETRYVFAQPGREPWNCDSARAEVRRLRGNIAPILFQPRCPSASGRSLKSVWDRLPSWWFSRSCGTCSARNAGRGCRRAASWSWERGNPYAWRARGWGNLTRRAGKYSERSAVVVRFSRSRGRCERQGILVEQAALEKAERKCVEDAEERVAARVRAAEARGEQDRELLRRMMERLADLFPGCPRGEIRKIAAHSAARGSGRVGRTAAGRNLEERALTPAAIAAIWHRHTNYDSLLASGVDRELAREQVADKVEEVLDAWRL